MKLVALLTVFLTAWSHLAVSQEVSEPQTGFAQLEVRSNEAPPRKLRICPGFDPAQDSYQLKVSNRLSELTILAVSSNPQFGLRCFRHEGLVVADTDGNREGCQVSIDPGVNIFRLEAVGPDDQIVSTYNLSILRNSLAGDTQVLVSNIDQFNGDNSFEFTRHIAQYFTTANEGSGYELREIKLRTSANQVGSLDVALYSVDEDMDVSKRLFNLRPVQPVGAREPSFAAPPDAVLEPGSTYAIYVRRTSKNLNLDATQSNLEDEKISDGWEIEDRFYVKQGARWVRSSTNASLRVAVKGMRFMTSSQNESPNKR